MSSMSDDQVKQAAATLATLRSAGSTISQLPANQRPTTFADAYRIQLALFDLVSESGPEAVGCPAMLKVGCTTPVTQQMLSVDEPIGGRLVAGQIFASGSSIPMSLFHHQPLIECEFAFRISADIDGDGGEIELKGLKAVVDAVAPALELVDNRFDQQLGMEGPSTVADNSMAAAVVLGAPRSLGPEVDGNDLASTTVRLAPSDAGPDAAPVAEGVGSEVLGDPWLSLLWAVNHERRLRRPIAAGTWVITGSCAGAPPVPLDEPLTAQFPGLGEVSVTVTT